MDPIRDAFSKIKEEMDELRQAINLLSEELEDQRNHISTLSNQTDRQTQESRDQTEKIRIQTHKLNELSKQAEEALDKANSAISIGNGGVQTDRQTIRQTDRHEDLAIKGPFEPPIESQELPKVSQNTAKIDRLEKVSQALDSLDDLKKDLRQQFKQLTTQEMSVFQSIYTLEEQGLIVDYSLISQNLALSESSIRDYVNNLLKKGIPIDKIKENNKKITLKISPNLRKIAPIDTILALRDL